MKGCLLRSIATHLLGVAAGGALAYVIIAAQPREETPPPAKHRSTTIAAKFSPTATYELECLMEDLDDDDSSPGETKSVHTLAREAIEEQARHDRANQAELARLRDLSTAYAGVTDLAPVITDTILSKDRDASRAIFIEWHRRDAAAAFDALAVRRDWLQSFDEILVLHLPEAEVIAQAARSDRPDDFRETLLARLGANLGEADQLPALSAALDKLDKPRQTSLLRAFADAWTPDNGVEAARFIGLEMPPAHQNLFLEVLEDARHGTQRLTWTAEFSKALFQYDLNVPAELFAALVEDAENAVTPTPPWDGFPAIDPADGVQPDLDASEAVEVLRDFLDHHLIGRRDFPALFAEDSVTIDEIAAEMRDAIPGAAAYPDALNRALYLKLAVHNPARAITWAYATIPDRLNRDTARIYEGLVASDHQDGLCEPRVRRRADLVHILQPRALNERDAGDAVEPILLSFDSWSRLAPDDASASLSRISPAHPIWSFRSPAKTHP